MVVCAGFANKQVYEDESLIWSPEDNPSLTSLDRSKELFNGTAITHIISTMYSAREEGANILQREYLQEMIDFEEELFKLSVCSDGHFDKNAVDPTWGCIEGSGYYNITLDSICKQMNLTLDEEDFDE
jgi:hypothetical protein